MRIGFKISERHRAPLDRFLDSMSQKSTHLAANRDKILASLACYRSLRIGSNSSPSGADSEIIKG